VTGGKRFLVKVCGVTSPEDAALAVSAGADAVGVNLWPGSKRFVDDGRALEVLAAVPAGVLKVGVFVDAPLRDVAAKRALLGLDRVQLHGDEKPEAFVALGGGVLIRAARVRDQETFAAEGAWNPGLWLYDAHAPGYGGSGVQAPWDLIARYGRRPFLLAGGLTPDNVAAAIAATRPDGVDVASGVESEPRRKDAARVRRFIDEARAAAQAIVQTK
jgi:phosphoribosylanthranilate isomerase